MAHRLGTTVLNVRDDVKNSSHVETRPHHLSEQLLFRWFNVLFCLFKKRKKLLSITFHRQALVRWRKKWQRESLRSGVLQPEHEHLASFVITAYAPLFFGTCSFQRIYLRDRFARSCSVDLFCQRVFGRIVWQQTWRILIKALMSLPGLYTGWDSGLKISPMSHRK